MTGLSQGRRMDRFKEALMTANEVLANDKISYGVLFDMFHCPFPETAGDSLEVHGGSKDIKIMRKPPQDQDASPFSRSPLEILEPIFTNMPVSDIYAARFTCRSWYITIMSSSHILESVVDVDKLSERKKSADYELRDLQRQLDIDADLVKCPPMQDPWRIRYHYCKVNFSIPPTDDCLHKNPCSPSQLTGARFCIDGTPVSALITTPARFACSKSTRNLVFYKFSGVTPRFIARLELPNGTGCVHLSSTAVVGRSESWDITVKAGDQIDHYRIESSKAYSEEEPAYRLLRSDNVFQVANPLDGQGLGGSTWTLSGSERTEWNLLGCLPRIDVSTRVRFPMSSYLLRRFRDRKQARQQVFYPDQICSS